MSLWWLQQPQRPRRIGFLSLQAGNLCALEYDRDWIADGIALSDDLPLRAGLQLPIGRSGDGPGQAQRQAPGAIDDARPDRWGERVIRFIEAPSRLSILELLYFAGDDRFGALGVSLADDHYAPRDTGALPSFEAVPEIERLVHKVTQRETVSESERRLLRPSRTLGGARPKSLLMWDGAPWVVKFADGDALDTPLIEHASMKLARACGIRTADTRAIRLAAGHAVAVRRFDRQTAPDGTTVRLHALSAGTVLNAAGEPFGYPALAQLLRRLAPAEEVAAEQQQLFRRMVFNILLDNTDDHEKNHAFLADATNHLRLSPAFDIVPTLQGLRHQEMQVGDAGSAGTLDNALTRVRDFGLRLPQAKQIVAEVVGVIDTWQTHFLALGVQAREVDELATYLDAADRVDERRRFNGTR